jgi:hypothetical protein
MKTIRRRGRGAGRIASGMRARAAGAALVALTVLAAGCGGSDEPAATTPPPGPLPQGAEPVRLDPANFTTKIDNPYWPMTPGSRWVYTDTEGGRPPERVEITVTNRTKVVAGVRARVIHDVAKRGSELVEDTFDWFAQDRAGNIWYLGEATRGYSDGKPGSTRGSWEAGVDGAQAGIAVPAGPRPGLEYRQEYRKGEAEDAASVLSVDEQVESHAGHFGHALLTKEFTPLEPKGLEYKLYAKGVGLVLALGISGDASREELVSYRKGGG